MAKNSVAEEASLSDIGEQYEFYGRTPPRTRVLRKHKERKNKNINGGSNSSSTPRMTKKFGSRRNTVVNMFDEMFSKADTELELEAGKRSDKRSIKLLRGSERDLKLDIHSAQAAAAESKEIVIMTPQSRRIASCQRFMSLCSQKMPSCFMEKKQEVAQNPPASNEKKVDSNLAECHPDRVEFHQVFNMLVKMGSATSSAMEFPADTKMGRHRRLLSREEYVWQTELKDLIWLELKAYLANRTIGEQDDFLCNAREVIGPLLNNIMTYRFVRKSKDCPGCLSMYCESCMEVQNDALREVEELLLKLESVEGLFPSTKALAESFSLYNSQPFITRVKAMCLWYNMTKHQRLKLVILGKLLALLDSKDYQWPMQLDSGVESAGSASDSNNSTTSTSTNSSSIVVNEYLLNEKAGVDMYNTTPIISMVSKRCENSASPYRKYIENILKTRGLSKSMSFLDKLHRYVLSKAQMTLQRPTDMSIFDKYCCEDQNEELIRFGSWSPEARSLNLPPYKASFMFLAAVPLEVVHEFIRMRLEQKPKKPSPLSVRQLMRELKEGIKIATVQRERLYSYMATIEDCTDNYTKSIEIFEKSLELIVFDYLEYLNTWALLQHDSFQKSLLEEEWNFICDIVKNIPNGIEMANAKFCSILAKMLRAIEERLRKLDELIIGEYKSMLNEYDADTRRQNLFLICRELQSEFVDEHELSLKIIAFAKNIVRHSKNLEAKISNCDEFKTALVALKCRIPKTIEKVQQLCDISELERMDEADKASFVSRFREVLMQCYKFGFDVHKEMIDFVPADKLELLARSMVSFAHLWMSFTMERCERGRGKRPRWAYQGLDFLVIVCEPQYTLYLSDEEFAELKNHMDACVSHVIGTTGPPVTPDSGIHSSSPKSATDIHVTKFPRSRNSSPSPRATYRSQRSHTRKTSVEQNSPISDADSPNFNTRAEESLAKLQDFRTSREIIIRESINQLEGELETKLKKQQLIGRVVSKDPDQINAKLRRRTVNFSWQRGIKIGQGRFGKVYTAVNNDTGEMLAVKEVTIQPNDLSIRKVTEELKVIEGISHRNLVRYFGLEIHKEEMLIFMEFCPEGTLESLVQATEIGLPELLIRRYTYQLICGLCVLHEHGIVHRDIKSANIFLTDEGNCLKIGDFGCAVKIKSYVTMPGELQGFIGTQAYMAPEMFMKTSIIGHGRAADIWSVGCVVVEMATGKRPWAEYDSNYQIMFKVGMGEKPEAPDNLIEEGHDFLNLCLQHDPKNRATAYELQHHNFVQIGDDL